MSKKQKMNDLISFWRRTVGDEMDGAEYAYIEGVKHVLSELGDGVVTEFYITGLEDAIRVYRGKKSPR